MNLFLWKWSNEDKREELKIGMRREEGVDEGGKVLGKQ